VLTDFSLKYSLIKRIPIFPDYEAPQEYFVVPIQKEHLAGSGGFGKVYNVLGRLLLYPQGQLQYIAEPEVWVAKRQKYKQEPKYNEFLQNEYAMTPPHLHMQPPVIVGDHSWLMMHKKQRLDLKDFLFHEEVPSAVSKFVLTKKISVDEAIEYSLAVFDLSPATSPLTRRG
jgi:hypothetical protein